MCVFSILGIMAVFVHICMNTENCKNICAQFLWFVFITKQDT